MDETPELPAETAALPVEVVGTSALEPIGGEPAPEPAGPPPATARTLARDALLDLLAAFGTGAATILFGAIAIGVVLGFTTGGFGAIQSFVLSPWGIAAMLLATQLPLLYFGLRRRRRNREKQRPIVALFGGEAGPAIRKGVSVGLGLTLLSMLYSSGLQWLFGPDAVQSQIEFLEDIFDNKLAVAALVFIIAGLAPVCEELFFRGAIFGSARAAGLSKAGAAISAVLFATVHLSPLLAPFYAAFAVVMCWLYTRTGTLAAPIAAHMTLNGVACLALLAAGGDRV